MKRNYYALILVFIPFLLPAETPPSHIHLSGIWEVEYSRRLVYEIREVRGGLELKFRNGNWVFFDQTSARRFKSYNGSRIKILGPRTIKYSNNYTGRTFLLRLIESYSQCYLPDTNYDTPYENYGSPVSGSWRMQGSGDYLFIELTRNGLRAKSEDLDRWYYYEQVSRHRYLDEKGNEYKLLDNGVLRWTRRDGQLKLWFDKA